MGMLGNMRAVDHGYKPGRSASRGGVMDIETGRFYRCPECGEEFLIADEAERHIEGPVFFCPACGCVEVEPVFEAVTRRLSAA
jgi:predicted RNA-binding Zn-ribbon protein involved in translation (DUF1610 family)